MSEIQNDGAGLTPEQQAAFDCLQTKVPSDALRLLIDQSFAEIASGNTGVAVTPPEGYFDEPYGVSITREGFSFQCGGDEKTHTIPLDQAQTLLADPQN